MARTKNIHSFPVEEKNEKLGTRGYTQKNKKRLQQRVPALGTRRDTSTEAKVSPWGLPPHDFLWNFGGEVLGVLLKNDNAVFNIAAYARAESCTRKRVYRILSRLKDEGLVMQPHVGNHVITEKGRQFCAYFLGKSRLRGGCGTSPFSKTAKKEQKNHSLHYICYNLRVTQKPEQINKQLLSTIKGGVVKEWSLSKSHIQYSVSLGGATVVCTPKKIMVKIPDVVASDVEESLRVSLDVLSGVLDKLHKIGIECDGAELEQAHFARVGSALSQVLAEVDGHYYVELGDSRKFWIDNSTGKLEDETNYFELRKRLDEFVKELPSTSSTLRDVDELRVISEAMLKLVYLSDRKVRVGHRIII